MTAYDVGTISYLKRLQALRAKAPATEYCVVL